MKEVWQLILLAVLMLLLAVSVALIMEHIIMDNLGREAARELTLEIEAYQCQTEQFENLL